MTPKRGDIDPADQPEDDAASAQHVFPWRLGEPTEEPPDLIEPAGPNSREPSEPAPGEPAPTEPTATAPATDWDTPTVASPVIPGSAAEVPTVAMPAAAVARQEFPGFGVPVDRSLDGRTELLGAQAVGRPLPVDEGAPTSAPTSTIESLFGDGIFVAYEDEPIARLPGTVALTGGPKPPKPPASSAPMSRTQKILLGVAAGLVAVLALVALFLLGNRIAQSAPAPSNPPASASAPADPAVTVGPVAAGEHNWSDLLGGECLAPFESAWQDEYTVVDCAEPHPAQLLHRGVLEDAADAAYPGVDALQARIVPLCTAPQIIDYPATGGATDIQISASFPADEQDWADGNRAFFCFASRTDGAEFTNSIAVPAA